MIVGGPGQDTIRGRGGDDRICGLAGADTIAGGQGNDRVDAGGGDDDVNGGGGDDRLGGKAGDDTVNGGAGSNIVNGGDGTDVCSGSPGDTLRSCNEAQAPRAVADAATVGEDSTAVTVDVLANDTLPQTGPSSVQSVTQPAHGTVVITGGGAAVTYLPNARYCNDGVPTDDFTYMLTPGGSTAKVAVTVTCGDDAPVAVDDAKTVAEDAAATTINVLGNDTDADGGPKSVVATSPPAHGTVTVTGGGASLTYEPAANYCNGGTPTDDFTYTLAPGGSIAVVEVTVTCVDDAPTAVGDTATVAEDSSATAIDVLTNDTDIDGGPQVGADGDPACTRRGRDHRRRDRADLPAGRRLLQRRRADRRLHLHARTGGTTATVAVAVDCLSATISPNPDTIASATLGVPVARGYTVQNTGPTFTGRAPAGPVASARVPDRPSRTQRRSSSRSRSRRERPTSVPGQATRPIPARTSTSSSTTARPAPACWPTRVRAARPTSPSRSPTRRPASGSCSSTASTCPRAPRPTTTSTPSPARPSGPFR